MINLSLNEIAIRDLEKLARNKAKTASKDKSYWLKLADILSTSIPKQELPGLKD